MSLIQCDFDYACPFWYPGVSQLLRNRLQVTQNKINRVVLKWIPTHIYGQDVLKLLDGCSASKRIDQIILNQVFKINSDTSPDYMIEHFVPASTVHSYSTRFTENGSFSLPNVKRFGIKYFCLSGMFLWNELPNRIKQIQDLSILRIQLNLTVSI